jgi:hypothetical protein
VRGGRQDTGISDGTSGLRDWIGGSAAVNPSHLALEYQTRLSSEALRAMRRYIRCTE